MFSADASKASLMQADLSGIRAARSKWRRAVLAKANLTGAVLDDSDFTGADLIGARIEDASFRDAYLTEAALMGVALDAADLRGAWVDRDTWDVHPSAQAAQLRLVGQEEVMVLARRYHDFDEADASRRALFERLRQRVDPRLGGTSVFVNRATLEVFAVFPATLRARVEDTWADLGGEPFEPPDELRRTLINRRKRVIEGSVPAGPVEPTLALLTPSGNRVEPPTLSAVLLDALTEISTEDASRLSMLLQAADTRSREGAERLLAGVGGVSPMLASVARAFAAQWLVEDAAGAIAAALRAGLPSVVRGDDLSGPRREDVIRAMDSAVSVYAARAGRSREAEEPNQAAPPPPPRARQRQKRKEGKTHGINKRRRKRRRRG